MVDDSLAKFESRKCYSLRICVLDKLRKERISRKEDEEDIQPCVLRSASSVPKGKAEQPSEKGTAVNDITPGGARQALQVDCSRLDGIRCKAGIVQRAVNLPWVAFPGCGRGRRGGYYEGTVSIDPSQFIHI